MDTVWRVFKRTASSQLWSIPGLRRSHANMVHQVNLLLAEPELGDDILVTLGIVGFQVVEQATPLAHQHEKATARTVILKVRFEVVRQLTNALAQQRDLDFGTARIGGMRAMLIDDGSLMLSGQHYSDALLSIFIRFLVTQ